MKSGRSLFGCYGVRWNPRNSRDRRTRPNLHQPVHNYAVACTQPSIDQPLVSFPIGRSHISNLNLLFLVYDKDKRALGALQDRSLRNEDRVCFGIPRESNLHKLPRQKGPIRIGERDSCLT